VVVPPASGGISGNGGAGGVGGAPATGGVAGTGGSTSAPDGSVSTTDLDSCSSDADCMPCLWAPAPTDASQCPGYFNCCWGMSATKKRCQANQAAWNASCPGQNPQNRACPCVLLCEGDMVISCVEGRCLFTCPPNNDASPEAAFVSDDALGPYCGDGVVNGTEECDNGKNDDDYGSTSGCAPGCKLPARCGDGIVQKDYGEVCDDGSKNAASTDPNVAYGKCMSNCKVGGWCGDGVVNGAEQCDDGVNDGTYRTCNPDCTGPGPWCGDGIVQPEYGEECEPTMPDDPYCTAACRAPGRPCTDRDCIYVPYCGDGILNGPEECDDGILDGSYGGCTPQCKLAPHCGDGVVNGPEECDHGADNGRDGMCSSSCRYIIFGCGGGWCD
jgi:cysteine-rich repeat protein